MIDFPEKDKIFHGSWGAKVLYKKERHKLEGAADSVRKSILKNKKMQGASSKKRQAVSSSSRAAK